MSHIGVGVSVGGSITLKVDGTENTSQTILDLISGTNMTVTDNGDGTVTLDAASSSPTPRVVLALPLNTEAISTTLSSGADCNLGGLGRRSYTGTNDGAGATLRVKSSWAALTPSIFDLNPELQAVWMWQSSTATDSVSYLVVGTSTVPAQATGALTVNHFGFINDTSTTYGSNANGSTQTLTTLTGLTTQQDDIFRAVVDSGTNVKFYYNGVLKGTSTTNLPTGAIGSYDGIITTGVKNDSGVTTGRQTTIGCISLSFDGE